MTYDPKQHKCLTCYFPVKDGEDESFIKMHNQLRYYHTDWRDCQAALRHVDVEAAQEMQEA